MLRTCPPQRFADRSRKLLNILRNEVGQVGIFCPVPYLLIGIKVRGVGRQPFDLYSSRKTLGQTTCDRTMYRPAIPHQDNTFGEMAQQSGHEGLGLSSGNITAEHVEIKTQSTPLRRKGNLRDDRQSVTPVPAIVNWRLATRRPGAADCRLQHKTAFIRENNGFTAFSSVFLCVANPAFAMRRWLVRRVRGRAVRVSDNSSPCDGVCAIPPTDRRLHRSVCVLVRQSAAGSIIGWNSPVVSGRVRAVAPAASTGDRSAGMERRDAIWLSKRPGRLAEKLLPTDKLQRVLRRNVWPPRTETFLDPAASWPVTDAAPRCCWKVKLPYKALSENSSCLSELFKVQ